MTVARKGGRPRKWSSDADRVRAFRARARGEAEPPTVEAAIDRSHESAAAWAQLRELSAALREERDATEALGRDLRTTRKALDAAERHRDFLEDENRLLRTEVERLSPSRHTPTPPVTRASEPEVRRTTPNRAERRAAQRQARRRNE